MKSPFLPKRPKNRGFALVATLSLMILLAVIAMGLLSLSAISLRNASHGSAEAEARANARLALIIAIGELQKYAGPDRAITATSEILATPSATIAKPNTTGVWESWWDFSPNTAPNYSAKKTDRFQSWLVSSADPDATLSRDFATTAWTNKTIELVGPGSLGSGAAAADIVTAGLVPVSMDGKVQGAYAWHVSDESVKARINLYRDPSRNATLAEKRALLAGQRPDLSVIQAPNGGTLDFLPSDLTRATFADATTHGGKLIHLNQAELLDQAEGKIKPLRNHITPYSLGVLADVRGSGLKQDLSSVFEAAASGALPSEFNGKNLYGSTHGFTGVSDPYWSTLAAYYNSFRNLANPDTNPTHALRPGTATIDPVPQTFNATPVIAKVDTIFSVVARPLSNMANWISNTNSAGSTYDHMVNLIVTPVVTLHNPYNVNISFHQMEVEFKNIPVGFNFMFENGGARAVSQSIVPGRFECYNTMAYEGHRDPATGVMARNNKSFVLKIANWTTDDALSSNSSISGPIVLKPGQTIVCGPTFPSDSSFDQDTKSGSNVSGFDWQGSLLNAIKAKPAFTPGLGFEVSAVTISSFRSSHYPNGGNIPRKPAGFFPGAWRGHPFTLLRDVRTSPKRSDSTTTDRFFLEYKIVKPYWYVSDSTTTPTKAEPSFAVSAKIQASDRSRLQEFAKLQFDYGDESTLQNLFDNRVYRYPPTGSFSATNFEAPPGTRYSSQSSFVHPFAIFSAYSRTTNGGVYETGQRTMSGNNSPQVNLLRDGRLAGKPFLFHNPSRSNFTLDLATAKPGVQAYELNFQPFLSRGDYEDYMDVDNANRVPSLTGNKTGSGIKSGSYLELPSGPMQTIADFRRSNALTTSHLPHFVQPVANSLLHPLMSPGNVIESNSDISPNALLDHSVLANHALYDRFYFSTFATSDQTKPGTVFEQFMNGTAPLASQAFEPYLPSGKTVALAKSELYSSDNPNIDTYKNAAEYQMIRGPFNVNSTSIQAWMAMLASMSKTDIATLWARSGALESVATSGAPITAMSMVSGGAVNGTVDPSKIDNLKTNNWNGYRVLDETELERLAIEIVAEVRARGPFLSMSEFVNRRVGPISPLTLSGALEAAISRAEINEKQNAAFPGSFLDQVPITTADISDPKLYNYRTPEATTGNPAAGAPGWINQGDLMRILEPSATVRGDTFVIRTYGEAKDASGNVTARAYAEAVVQRVPEHVDPKDRPSVNVVTDQSASAANKTFGRRMNIVSFRWLSANEI